MSPLLEVISQSRDRRPFLAGFVASLCLLLAITSCTSSGEETQAAQVKHAFELCKTGLINHQTDQVMACIPRNVDDYLNQLKASEVNPSVR